MSKLARNLLIAGLLLTFACPAIGLVITVCFMVQSFHDLGQNGITDPTQLSGHIGSSLVATAAGCMGIVPGLALIVASILLSRSERRNAKQTPLP
jgi:biopolymer transport protein ExbB/TolQ